MSRLGHKSATILAVLLSCPIGWMAIEKPGYALLGLAAGSAGLIMLRAPVKWLLWASIFFAPVDIYRVELGGIHLSFYRILLLAAAASWAVRALPRIWEFRIHLVFAALFTTYAMSSIAWFFSTRYEIVGVGEVLNVSSGLLLILLFYFVFDNYDDWKRTVGVFALSGIWVVLGLAYTYGLFFSTGQLVADIPFRDAIPLVLGSSGWLAHRHNVGGVPKLALPFTSPPHLGGFLAALLSLLIVLYLYMPHLGRKRKWLLIYAGVLVIPLILTFARSGWLAFVFALAVITIDLVRSQRTRAVLLPLRVFMVLTLVVVGVVMVSPDPVVRSLLARFSTGADTDLRGHVQTRLDALGIWVTDPKTFLFGVGFSNYSLYGSDIHSHSPYTTVLGERGLVGSLPFWAFYFGVSVWAGRRAGLWRKLDPDRFSMLLGIFAATVGVLFGSIFYEYIHRNVVWILFALAAGTIRTTGWEAKNALRDGPRSQEE